MNDLHFIKYKPHLMMLDTLGMSQACKVAHRQLFDLTIIQDGPPLNDDKKLRELASCPTRNWVAVKAELMTKGWCVQGGFFLHKGTIATLNESKAEYVASYNKTAAANKRPPLAVSKPDAVTGCVTVHVTGSVTPDVTAPTTSTHLQLQLQSPYKKAYKPLSEASIGKAIKSDKADKVLKKLLPGQKSIADEFEKMLGDQWVNDAGKWVNRIKQLPAKSARVMAELHSALKEKRVNKTPAQYAEQIWKEFK